MLRSGGSGAEKQPATWRFLQAISANTNFTMEKGKWYRVHAYGRSGNGGSLLGDVSNRSAGGAGGGGSGGYACSILMEKRGAVVPCTVSAAITSFGSYLSATAGGNGENTQGQQAWGHSGGTGGSASGGNIQNIPGSQGGAGGESIDCQNVLVAGNRGGNAGGYGGAGASVYGGGAYHSSGGGGGGARLPSSPYTGGMGEIGKGGQATTTSNYTQSILAFRDACAYNPPALPAWNINGRPLLYGGGGGGGGRCEWNATVAVNAGAIGTPGLIIIEVGGDQ